MLCEDVNLGDRHSSPRFRVVAFGVREGLVIWSWARQRRLRDLPVAEGGDAQTREHGRWKAVGDLSR